ncbi:MAG: response regulator transcription factor [Anaerolineae bacterium]|nr:response regulator transcription factor [Anaerolineae bacterium]
MEKTNSSALIAAQPGPLRHVLYTLLLAMPQVKSVAQTDDATSTLQAITEHHPVLVLLDASLPGNGTISVVKKIKADGFLSRCLVLADNKEQQQTLLAAGADGALLKGFPAAKLLEIIEQLVSGQEAQEI